jgi:hypothetical protein
LRRPAQEKVLVSMNTKAGLSESRRQCVELMQRLGHGEVVGLLLRAGEPILDPPPRTVHDVKLAPPRTRRPRPSQEDFALKEQVVQLFRLFERVRDGVIDSIEVRDGLPFRVRYTGSPA